MPATPTIAIIDTTFSTIDMGTIVLDQITHAMHDQHRGVDRSYALVRRTVPGFKDLTAASRAAIDAGASIVLACGMPGPEPIDESCAKDASFGLQMTQALTGVPVLEIFVHMSEALTASNEVDADTLLRICDGRCRGHADNAIAMLDAPEVMIERAGTGRRQGGQDVGPLELLA